MNLDELKDNALRASIIKFDGGINDYKSETIKSAAALMWLILYERNHNSIDIKVHTRILHHLRNVVTGGREPCLDVQHYWSYPILACGIYLAKKTPIIWNELTEEEKAKFNILMTGFAITSNYISNDFNHYRTGLNLKGNVDKHWNPNYKLSLVIPIIISAHYFGGSDELDNLLVNFNYDSFIQQCEAFNFTNITNLWKRESFYREGTLIPGVKEMLSESRNVYIIDKTNIFDGGKGVGALIPYKYNGFKADEYGVVKKLLENCYGGGPVLSVVGDNGDGTYDAYILGGLTSPVEGQEGMFKEFNGVDSFGTRSDAHYCAIDFTMIVFFLATLKEMNIWNETLDVETYQKVCIGNIDLIFKFEKGYLGGSNGKQHISKEHNLFGYLFAKDCWNRYFIINEV